MRTVVAIGHDGMGHGDAALGRKILATFLRKSPALSELTAIVLWNSGVKLIVEESPLLVEFRQLHDHGVDVKPCGTCLDHFGLREKIAVGGVSSMDEILLELDRAEKVISL